ncbi:hypothetical protein R1T16_03900 [Flavobacterium sp. DG1-102-2]|uniref:hypothetical protein n=1 Tax=Flavobacterium sp. DG1-102-2 TaxID=3081663 RepID=UPI002949A6FF|nr:hypothetical protein [Flavobacterium sp. DG1-102-2]MDV6167555.1 hypothetical protein [Flavobacterium sp. DG1-102-2]
MGKYRNLIIASLIFFVLVNTTYYWEGVMGGFAIITLLLMVIYFIVLAISLLGQTYFAIKERLQNRQRLLFIGLMTTVLTSAFFFPKGIVDFEKIESDIVLIAESEGVANCMTTLKLRQNNTFKNREVCFGIAEKTGTYRMKGDTIFFKSNSWGRGERDFYEFAVLERRKSKKEKYLGRLVQFKNKSDTRGISLVIIKNNLDESVTVE